MELETLQRACKEREQSGREKSFLRREVTVATAKQIMKINEEVQREYQAKRSQNRSADCYISSKGPRISSWLLFSLNQSIMNIAEVRICGRYRIIERLRRPDEEIRHFLAVNIQSNELVYVKFQDNKLKSKKLISEGRVLQSMQGGIGIPSMYWCGQDDDSCILVTELMEKNLFELQKMCKHKLSLKTVLQLADKMIDIIHYLHFKMMVMRVHSPCFWSIGSGDRYNNIYLSEFQYIKKVSQDLDYLEEIPSDQNGAISAFTSPFILKYYIYDFKDDLISLFYTLIFLLKGSLPWLHSNTLELFEKGQYIKQVISKTSIEEITQGTHPVFSKILRQLYKLQLRVKPDYSLIKALIRQTLFREGYDFDEVYDWLLLPPQPIKNLQLFQPIQIEVIPNEEEFMRDEVQAYVNNSQKEAKTQRMAGAETIKVASTCATILTTKPDKKQKQKCLIV